MATMHDILGYMFLIFLWVYPDPRQHLVETQHLASPIIQTAKRQTLVKIYKAEIGVREATGNNDGPRVEEYLRYCGLGKGYNWCSAYVCWCLGQAGIANPKNPWAPAIFPAKRVGWERNGRTANPQPGDVFGIYFTELKRIAHCGFVDQWDGKWCVTVEGNSENAVVKKRRLVSTIYRVSNWIDSYN